MLATLWRSFERRRCAFLSQRPIEPRTKLHEHSKCLEQNIRGVFLGAEHQPRPSLAYNGNYVVLACTFPNGGDTMGLSADKNGTFHAVWSNGERGGLPLWQTDFALPGEQDKLVEEILLLKVVQELSKIK